MTARPILFSAPMVRALLDGRKTQTRRVVRNVDAEEHTFVGTFDERDGLPTIVFSDAPGDQVIGRIEAKCPYGKPGDLLWVRESMYKIGHLWVAYKADSQVDLRAAGDAEWKSARVVPSIHVPRVGSRLTLELTGVRVERLKDISEADAAAEGGRAELYQTAPDARNVGHVGHSYVLGYRHIWEKINGPGSWDANPWVWVLEFNVHHGNVDEILRERAA